MYYRDAAMGFTGVYIMSKLTKLSTLNMHNITVQYTLIEL